MKSLPVLLSLMIFSVGAPAPALPPMKLAPTASTKKAQPNVPAQEQTLAPGNYSAKVKALVCEGCAAFIQDSLKGFAGIENLKVDQKAKMVRFSVKKDAVVKVADLQKALKSASDEMGMGADYSLSELRKS